MHFRGREGPAYLSKEVIVIMLELDHLLNINSKGGDDC